MIIASTGSQLALEPVDSAICLATPASCETIFCFMTAPSISRRGNLLAYVPVLRRTGIVPQTVQSAAAFATAPSNGYRAWSRVLPQAGQPEAH